MKQTNLVKKKTTAPKRKTKKKEFNWQTVEQVFQKASPKSSFKRAYKAETERIKLAQTLKGIRVAKKWTQATVAKKAQMPQSVIARLESGAHGMSIDTLSRVANALEKQVEIV